jgi:hypothetical protein
MLRRTGSLGFCVRGQIIAAFGRVVPLRTLGDGRIRPGFEVAADVSAIVLLNPDRRVYMLQNNVQKANPELAQLGSLRENLVGDQMAAPGRYRERNRLLNDLHCVSLITKPHNPEFTKQKSQRNNFTIRCPFTLFQTKDCLDRGAGVEAGSCVIAERHGRWEMEEIFVAEQNHVVEQSEAQ